MNKHFVDLIGSRGEHGDARLFVKGRKTAYGGRIESESLDYESKQYIIFTILLCRDTFLYHIALA